MRKKAASLLLLLCGCNVDRAGFGIAVRQGRESYGHLRVEKNFPTIRVQLEKNIRDDFKLYSRVEGIQGGLKTSQYLLEGDLYGRFASIGTGFRYFPFSENLSFDLGGELFYADVTTRGKVGFMTAEEESQIFGWGLNAGITGEIPLNEETRFFVSGGYNLTDNIGGDGNFDLDGLYFFSGLSFEIK